MSSAFCPCPARACTHSYGDKFGTFQKTLEKSNKTFDNLKKELDAGE
jgi:hypothetical protein